MSIKKLYLHVGMQKTATSSIQQTLYQNKKLLNQYGLFYPDTWSSWHVKEFGDLFPCEEVEKRRTVLYKRDKLDKNGLKQLRINTIKSLQNEIKVHQKYNLILSAESLVLFSKQSISDIKKIIETELHIEEIEVIIYVREKKSFMNSMVQQYIKSAIDFQLNEVIDKYQNCYFESISKFVQIFGKKNVSVYKLEDAYAHQYGPVGLFLNVLGVNDKDISLFDIKKTNEGISNKAASLIKYINNKSPLIENDQLSNKRKIGDVLPIYNIKGDKFNLGDDINEKILYKSKEDILWLKVFANIDYTKKDETFENTSKIIFDEVYYQEIKNVYLELTPLLQGIVEKYITKHYDGKEITLDIFKEKKNEVH